MVVGGGYSPEYDVEVVSHGYGAACAKPADYPVQMSGMVGTFLGNKVHTCGGHQGTKTECHAYDLQTREWTRSDFSLATPRTGAVGTLLSNGTWLVIGGAGSATTSEMLVGNAFVPGPPTPTPMSGGHCLAEIAPDRVLITGGEGNENAAHIFDAATSEWTRVADMSVGRNGHACGFVKKKNGAKEIVVVGGKSSAAGASSEMFSVDAMEWRVGPQLDHKIYQASYVQGEESFVVAGGIDGGDFTWHDGAVYGFDAGRNEWRKKIQKLKMKRLWATAVAFPSDVDLCP